MNQELLDQVKAKMQEYVDQEIPILKRSISTDDAIERFHKHRMYDKERLFLYRRVSRVNVYSIDGFEDYFYGYMVPNTKYIRYFNLKLYEYGFVLMLPFYVGTNSAAGVCAAAKAVPYTCGLFRVGETSGSGDSRRIK